MCEFLIIFSFNESTLNLSLWWNWFDRVSERWHHRPVWEVVYLCSSCCVWIILRSVMKYVFGCGWLKGSLRSTHTLMQIQTVKMLSNPRLPLAALRILFFHFFFLSKSDILFAFCSVLTLCSPDCYFSVQQCPSEHEDSAAEPDSPNGELGTPSDRLPPAYHQLHRLLQLGQTWRGRWKHLHQDWRPEHGEYRLLELMTRSDWCT